MMKQQQQKAVPLCMAFLMAFLVVSAMHAVAVEAAGRGVAYEPLDPGRTPSSGGPGKPYTRPCVYANNCPPHDVLP